MIGTGTNFGIFRPTNASSSTNGPGQSSATAAQSNPTQEVSLAWHLSRFYSIHYLHLLVVYKVIFENFISSAIQTQNTPK